jgi:hypothetical protein
VLPRLEIQRRLSKPHPLMKVVTFFPGFFAQDFFVAYREITIVENFPGSAP